MTMKEFDELLKKAGILYIKRQPKDVGDIKIKFSKRHEKQMKELFESIK